mgnify:CR=1 FL=1
MKKFDVRQEEEVLALMIHKHTKHGMRELQEIDFVATSDNITPKSYTKEIFNAIQKNTFSGMMAKSVDKNILKKFFESQIDLTEENRVKYSQLVDKLVSMPIVSDDIDYFHKCCDKLKIYTQKRQVEVLCKELCRA